MAVSWTKYWGPADDGTVLKGIDLRNIQDDINSTGLTDASSINGSDVDVATPADDGKALTYNYSLGTYEHTDPSGIPSGVGPIPWPTDSAPAGWLLCYGQEVSRTTYANLFAVIGTTFGVGDTSTTFNMPDLRGRVPLGKDNMGGVSADRVTDTAADSIAGSDGAEEVGHDHTTTGGSSSGPSATVHVDDNSGGTDYNVGSETHTHTFGAGSTNTVDTNVVQPYMTFNYIMKT